MIARGANFKPYPLNIVGSSTFGRYPKISVAKTYNMFQSDDFLVPYAGYQVAFPNLGEVGRGIYNSTKFNRMVVVVDNKVFLAQTTFNQKTQMNVLNQVVEIGTLQTSSGVVFIIDNNKPQIAIVDGVNIYIYDPTQTPSFQIAKKDSMGNPISFVPGYITFHDTYFICAASNDTFAAGGTPGINNTWRLSESNNGLIFPDSPSTVGFLETKSDNTQAVIRFPSRGNMIFVMGQTVTESWFDQGAQVFPYQRNNQYNIDYGCLNPDTIAYMDELVVWLAANEQSGPIIVASTGGNIEKITTDGIDYLFSNLQDPADSRAFLFRQDGHLFYHINFYTDNFSLFIDFLPNGQKKIYHACDQNINTFIADQVAFFNNQYYFITNQNGNVYAFDTIFTTFDGLEIPRFRVCSPDRNIDQEYRVINDIGFTIEQGHDAYQQAFTGPIFLITQDSQFLITQASEMGDLVTQDDMQLVDQTGLNDFITQQAILVDDFSFLIAQQMAQFMTNGFIGIAPRVDLSISIDGGESFSSDLAYYLNPLGHRKNRLMWWNMGVANDLTCKFRFWGFGRFVATDGLVQMRQ
jgi:hypothetical protein